MVLTVTITADQEESNGDASNGDDDSCECSAATEEEVRKLVFCGCTFNIFSELDQLCHLGERDWLTDGSNECVDCFQIFLS